MGSSDGSWPGRGHGDPDYAPKRKQARETTNTITDVKQVAEGYQVEILFVDEEIRDTDTRFASDDDDIQNAEGGGSDDTESGGKLFGSSLEGVL